MYMWRRQREREDEVKEWEELKALVSVNLGAY